MSEIKKLPEIQIPVPAFEKLIDIACKWLEPSPKARIGLEVKIWKEGARLEFSIGTDLGFVEMRVETEQDLVGFERPLYLDLSYLSNLDFKFPSLTVIQPQEGGRQTDRRAQFKSPGFNFRIPLCAGTKWQQASQDFSQFKDYPGIGFQPELMAGILPHMKLPDSFNQQAGSTDRDPHPILVLQPKGPNEFIVYASDSLGGFVHTVKDRGFSTLGTESRFLLQRSFFKVVERLKNYGAIFIAQKNNSTVGFTDCLELKIQSLSWFQSNTSSKNLFEVPVALEAARRQVIHYVDFDIKEFSRNVERALSFSKSDETRGIPFLLDMIGKQYALVLDSNDYRTEASGEALEISDNKIRIFFQAASLRDYLGCLTGSGKVSIERLQASITARQEFQEGESRKVLIYWMPLAEERK